jgi:hypothetical protein
MKFVSKISLKRDVIKFTSSAVGDAAGAFRDK